MFGEPQTELHRHLDLSIRLATLLELAQEHGIEGESTSLDSFRSKVVVDQPLGSLREVIERFDIFPRVMSRPDIIERIVYEVIEDSYYENIRTTELRFSLDFMCSSSGLSWDDILHALNAGRASALDTYPEMKVGFIATATREFGIESVARTVEFFLTHRDSFVGVDLAGNEDEFPCNMFQDVFKPVRSQGLNVTIHAGEAAGPENVWEAIDLLGAKRIGHGIRSLDDPRLVKALAERGICLENCPTSNWITGTVNDLTQHPLAQFLKADVPVCINTDDPTVFGTSFPKELEVCREKLGLTDDQIDKCRIHAEKASFLN